MMMRFVESDAALFELFAQTGLVAPRPIFVSLQFKVFLVRCEPGAAGRWRRSSRCGTSSGPGAHVRGVPGELAQVSGRVSASTLMTSMFLRIMLLSVPTSLVLGIMAIVRIRGEPQLSGIWLGVSAVLVSGGVIGSVAWVFSQWGAHY